jgi:hypothetical protein
LYDVQVCLLVRSLDFPGVVRAEHANSFDAFAGRVENPAALLGRYAARTVREDHSDIPSSNLGGKCCVFGARHTTELNFCEHHQSAQRR